MQIIHRIQSIDDIYFGKMWELYLNSFPLDEQRSHEDHIQAMLDDRFYCVVYLEDETLIAFMHYWDLPTCRFIEYFAVNPNTRGKGVGTQIIKEFATSHAKKLVLDIEEIVDEHTEKRWQFYKKMGFEMHEKICMHPPYQKDSAPFALHVLSFPKVLNDEEYNLFVYEERMIPLKYTYSKGE